MHKPYYKNRYVIISHIKNKYILYPKVVKKKKIKLYDFIEDPIENYSSTDCPNEELSKA